MVILYLRQENNDFLLQENGSKLIIEENTLFAIDASASTSMSFSVNGNATQNLWTDVPDSTDVWSDIPFNVDAWVTKAQGTNTWLSNG